MDEGLEDSRGERRVTAEAKGMQWWSVHYKYDPLDQCVRPLVINVDNISAEGAGSVKGEIL